MISTSKFYSKKNTKNMPPKKSGSGRRGKGRGRDSTEPQLARPGEFIPPRTVGQASVGLVAPAGTGVRGRGGPRSRGGRGRGQEVVSPYAIQQNRIDLLKARLIKLVRLTLNLYDKKAPGYSDKIRFRESWIKIATQLGMKNDGKSEYAE